MARGYLFISNSTKPSPEVAESTDPIGPNSFSKAAIWAANEMGWELHMGINRNHPENIKSIDYDIKFYNQHTYRNIFALRDNWKAYRNLCKYLRDNPQIEIIHCNTPIGGVVGRLAGRKFNKKVIYTAHGFHFYKGAPLFNRTILKWIEKFLAHYTDILITINQEDYEAALKFRLKNGGKVVHIPGVGISTEKSVPKFSKKNLLQILGIFECEFICICMGDLVKRKNYKTAIRAIALSQIKNIHFLICGIGPELDNLKCLSKKLGICDIVHFLGFRKDIKDLLSISDIFLFSSLQEGLPRSTMEAMAAGLPCIVSDIRGNRDLIDDGKGGFLCPLNNVSEWSKKISLLAKDVELRRNMGLHNIEEIKKYEISNIEGNLYEVFREI